MTTPNSTTALAALAEKAMPERKVRKTLGKTAKGVLEDYAFRHPEDTHPTKFTLQSLLKAVQAAEKDTDFKIDIIQRWFARRRKALAAAAAAAASAAAEIPGGPPTPTTPLSSISTILSEDQLRTLHTLVQNQPNPPSDVLDAWATVFKIHRTTLEYILLAVLPTKFPPNKVKVPVLEIRQTASGNSTRRLISASRLPTPPDSLTPEPVLRDNISPEYFKNSLPSPTLGYRPLTGEAPRQKSQSSAETLNHDPIHSHPSPPLTPVVLPAKVNPNLSAPSDTPATIPKTDVGPHETLAQAICSGVLVSCAKNVAITRGRTPLPRTLAESEARFAPYRESLEKLSRALNSSSSSSSPRHH
ncbi:hypothetical protein NP233_g395 [Leucocoprinus birnbaumii]|uniref:Uncharacterized protein n=1 Tax=Leucocoprinus birnbaumii TaxID=56174 RepID=A0AAD5YVT7_9AGAR|nr:hypothetical protein NP233_g395 [Leucocoprinus birnbaumii]